MYIEIMCQLRPLLIIALLTATPLEAFRGTQGSEGGGVFLFQIFSLIFKNKKP